MAPVQSQDTPQRAPQVCSHCKSIKKGCDKKLPSCSQCIKRRAVCRYGEHPDPPRYGDGIVNACQNIGVNGAASTWNSIPQSVLGRLNPGIRLSILLMNSISDVLYSDALGPNEALSTISIDNIIHSQVCHLIRTDGNYIESVASKHFKGVHKWLPIISKKRFYDRLQFFQSHPTADFSILLLTMHLMAQQPSSDLDVNQDREMLYLATKTLFTQVQTFIPSSMCLVQAGVILASYERGHDKIEAAYISIGTAARLACAIGIDTAQCSQELQGSDIWFDEEEALATWWGLTISDRNIACDNRMSGRPMAARPIRDEDYLPLEPADLAGDIDYSMSPTFRYFVSAVSLPTLGMFGREAQATHLLDKVKRAVDLMETDDQTFVTLGYELQTLLGKIIRQVAEQRTSYCGATQTLLVGLYILHRFAVEIMGVENQPEWAETMKVTLNTITRMTLDIVYGFNKDTHTLPIEALAPVVQHVARCAQEHIMACDNFQDTQWQQDLEELRQLLRFFNTRWTLAGHELHVLDKTVEMAMAY